MTESAWNVSFSVDVKVIGFSNDGSTSMVDIWVLNLTRFAKSEGRAI